MKYVALLRGINVGGKNKVAMADLRDCFEKEGFKNVSTYINSGNIFFETTKKSDEKLVTQCETAIEKRFGFRVVTAVISQVEFENAIKHAPAWWADGSKDTRNDALFVIPPTTTDEVLDILKKKADAPDKFATHGQVVFWSLPMADYNKSVVPKIIGTPIYKRITIRSSTTTKKMAELIK